MTAPSSEILVGDALGLLRAQGEGSGWWGSSPPL